MVVVGGRGVGGARHFPRKPPDDDSTDNSATGEKNCCPSTAREARRAPDQDPEAPEDVDILMRRVCSKTTCFLFFFSSAKRFLNSVSNLRSLDSKSSETGKQTRSERAHQDDDDETREREVRRHGQERDEAEGSAEEFLGSGGEGIFFPTRRCRRAGRAVPGPASFAAPPGRTEYLR